MEDKVVISLKNVHKNFRVYYDKGNMLKEKLLFWKRNKHEVREVLKGISFDVHKGEVIGLIGRNGCGKSTTLKMLTGIYYPNKGSLSIQGRVSSLIELGAGFHPDMTGRENIYTNASIFGLSKKEIDDKMDDIIAFSELGNFIDLPVRTYSSGMYMRLAFSVAINVNADVLLIDEILAVGDANFQIKCFSKLRELKAEGITIVIVTHDMSAITRLCNRCIWINDGLIKADGNTNEITTQYQEFMSEENNKRLMEEDAALRFEKERQQKEKEQKHDDEAHFGSMTSRITNAYLLNHEGKKTNVLESQKDMEVVIEYEVGDPSGGLIIGMGFNSLDMSTVYYGTNTMIDKLSVDCSVKKGKYIFHCHNMPLATGEYALNVSLISEDSKPIDFYKKYLTFKVTSNAKSIGVIECNHDWRNEK